MNNFQNEIDEGNLHQPANILISKSSLSNYTGTTVKKKPFLFLKKITSSKEMETLGEDISIISKKFIESFPISSRIENFQNKYKNHLNGSYVDIVLLIKEFPEFNIFDYLGIVTFNNMTNTEKKKLFQARNNILLSILLVAKQNQLFERISLSKKKNNTNLYNKPIKSSKFKFNNTVQPILNNNNNSNNNNKDETIFQNLNFLNNIADNIKKLLIDENSVECVSSNISSPLVRKHFSENKLNKTNSNEDLDYDYEVELFFLALLDYKDKARVIKQKNIYYFNNFIDDLNLPNKFNLDKIINEISIYRDISQLNPSELIFLRKILSNSAKRKLYHGIEFFTCSSTLNIYLSEGRIWKNIGLFFKRKNLFDLWIKYEKRIEKDKYLRQTQTILMEYGKKLTFLNNELIL